MTDTITSPELDLAAEVDLIPLRALNQVTYCPRLYYLEYVEAVMPINEHVEDGMFQHRRVDDPALQLRARKDGDTIHTRSVQLSSTRLGLTGKLDLIEEKDGLVYPVEYKRGAGPPGNNGQPPFWDNDAVQVCAQALLLEEELGVTIPHGILYYMASKTRVPVPFDEPLREKTLQAIRQIRELDTLDAPPPPLPADLRHRCFGCSLAPICQPEETLYCLATPQIAVTPRGEPDTTPRGEPASPAGTPGITRVLPQAADGAVLYLAEPGAHVGKRSEHLIVRKHGAEIQRVPIAAVRQVVVFGNVQMSTQALQCLAELEVPVVYMTGHGKFIAALQPAVTKNVSLRVNQVRLFADPAKALELAKAIVKAKISNQRTLLMRSLRSSGERSTSSPLAPVLGGEGSGERGLEAPTASPNYDCPTDTLAMDVSTPDLVIDDRPTRGADEPAAQQMAELLFRLDRIHDPAVLLGTEGQAAALYFSQFHRMLKAPVPVHGGRQSAAPSPAFDFKSRNRRPPRDPVNALLSFAYALLVKDCFSALCTVGFDPYCGFFHAGCHGKPSLALDLMEEFRAIIADSVVLTLINNGCLTPRDFMTWRDACHLTGDGRKRFFLAYEQRKATVVTHPVFGYKMAYGRMLEVQARMLAAHVRGDIPHYTGFTVR